MRKKLYEHYVNEIRAYVLVFQHMKYTYHLYKLMLFLSFLAILVIPVNLLLCIGGIIPFYSLSITIVPILLTVWVHKSFNQKAYDIVRKEFRLKVSRKKWRSDEFNRFQLAMLIDFLEVNGVYEKWKLEMLIEQYKKDIKASQMPQLVAPGILIALSVPNINQIVSYLYSLKPKGIINWEFVIFFIVFIFTFGVVMLTTMFYWIKGELSETFFSFKISNTRSLISLLEEALLILPNKEDD